ncbi:hypothetical protein BABINDRAFT_165380 [Babjeviella inositovora NRRL Y-12698]|uniref:Peroxin-3 n=1 Tax=Babjeviella inositovora NRRL Y-12698 TaxID=984486 RepID=A0A1E3QWG3_9ASCO|nr:uncharacterized protein BABINDRAFT_165380 [Babjeviella inositovora NRRL Y-12698]ODQ81864.1 hypothetical protein BABINDRAFT_165380 [Babjeviella inositovora NRRL Y-12698]
MFTYLRTLAHRHKRKLIVTTSIATLVYLAQWYVRKRIADFQARLSEEKFAREQIRRRFEQTQKDAYYTILSLLPVMAAPIFERLPVENITKSLQMKRAPGATPASSVNILNVAVSLNDEALDAYSAKSKAELWTELKIQSVTRLLTLVYASSALFVITRLQLNILARRSYLESAIQVANSKQGSALTGLTLLFSAPRAAPQAQTDEDEEDYYCEQAYVSMSWWLLNHGWMALHEKVQAAVEGVFADVSPRSELSIDDLSSLLADTVDVIEMNNKHELLSSFFPTNIELEMFVLRHTNPEMVHALHDRGSTLRVLTDETKRYIFAEPTFLVFNRLVNVNIDTLLNNILNNVGDNTAGKFKLASLLAQITKQSNELAKANGINDYLANMDALPELDELSAGVYSNFDN